MVLLGYRFLMMSLVIVTNEHSLSPLKGSGYGEAKWQSPTAISQTITTYKYLGTYILQT